MVNVGMLPAFMLSLNSAETSLVYVGVNCEALVLLLILWRCKTSMSNRAGQGHE